MTRVLGSYKDSLWQHWYDDNDGNLKGDDDDYDDGGHNYCMKGMITIMMIWQTGDVPQDDK